MSTVAIWAVAIPVAASLPLFALLLVWWRRQKVRDDAAIARLMEMFR